MKFKERITEELKTSTYTQKQIAKLLNISEGNISNWKKGTNIPSITILFELCQLLNISADYLLGLSDIPREVKKEKRKFLPKSKNLIFPFTLRTRPIKGLV